MCGADPQVRYKCAQVCGANTQVKYRCAQVCGTDTLRYDTSVLKCVVHIRYCKGVLRYVVQLLRCVVIYSGKVQMC